jgi:hypothetical protein
MSFQLRSLCAVATVLALSSLAGCSSKKDDATPTPNNSSPVGVTWTVDGTSITATSIQKSTTGNNFEFAGSYTVSTTNSKGVDITLPKAVGTYAIPGSGATAVQAIYLAVGTGAPAAYIATTGTVTVTSLTATNIIGTFSFTGTDSFNGTSTTKSVTNGTFNIAL